jgi:hypothetical protein
MAVAGSSCTSVSCGDTCKYNENEYETIKIGNQCWFAENLRTSKTPGGNPLTLGSDYYCYSGDSNCTNKNGDKDSCGAIYGAFYPYLVAMNGESYEGEAVQGLCPDGWLMDVPITSGPEDEWLSVASGGCGSGNGFNLPLAGYRNTSPNISMSRNSKGMLWSGDFNLSPFHILGNSNQNKLPVFIEYDGSGNVSSSDFDGNEGVSIRCVSSTPAE